MVEAIRPPARQLKTFGRAVEDLQKLNIVTEEDEENRIYLVGHEAKDIGISIGVRPLKVNIPFEKGAARRLLNKRPVLKHLITRREGLVYEILTGAGMLDKNTPEG